MTVGVGERRRSRRLAAPRNDATVHLIVGDDRTLRHVNLGRLILRAQAGQSGGRNWLPVRRGEARRLTPTDVWRVHRAGAVSALARAIFGLCWRGRRAIIVQPKRPLH